MPIEHENSFLNNQEDPFDDEHYEEDWIDLQALAEEIFQLLKYELMIENERRGR